MQTLQIGRDAKHHSLRGISTAIDMTFVTLVLRECMVLTTEDVSKAFEVVEEDPNLEMMLSNTRKGGRTTKTIVICICRSICTT